MFEKKIVIFGEEIIAKTNTFSEMFKTMSLIEDINDEIGTRNVRPRYRIGKKGNESFSKYTMEDRDTGETVDLGESKDKSACTMDLFAYTETAQKYKGWKKFETRQDRINDLKQEVAQALEERKVTKRDMKKAINSVAAKIYLGHAPESLEDWQKILAAIEDGVLDD